MIGRGDSPTRAVPVHEAEICSGPVHNAGNESKKRAGPIARHVTVVDGYVGDGGGSSQIEKGPQSIDDQIPQFPRDDLDSVLHSTHENQDFKEAEPEAGAADEIEPAGCRTNIPLTGDADEVDDIQQQGGETEASKEGVDEAAIYSQSQDSC